MRDIVLADTVYMPFTTRSFSTGAPTALAGTPVVSAYENADLTQITAGITLGVDHDGVTGLNMLTIVATGANGFEADKDYSLVITTGTVGGVSVVGEVVGQFSIQRAPVNWANVSDPTTSLSLSGTSTSAVTTLTTYTGNTPQTGDSFARLGAPAAASIAADILAIDNFVDGLESTLGAAGAGLTAVPWNAAWDAEVQSEVNDGLVAYDAASTTNITAGTITTTTNLTNLPAITANWLTAAGLAADAVAEIADGVWDEALAGHVGADSAGLVLNEWQDAGRLDLILDTIAADVVNVDGYNLATQIGTAGAGLTNIGTIATVTNLTNLPAITANWLTAAGTAADFTTEIQSGLATAAELTKVPKSDGTSSWNATALAAINAEVDAALDTAISELGVAAPSATPSVRTALMLLYMALRNSRTTTATVDSIRNDAGSAITTAALSDDATTFTKAKYT